ncbi:DUF488 domain-containing protein [uncultured Thalassospira sp.]|uniref:DUF488 domain-containing protein n=1 Tax=uncultured Thalassospira sp. TaxID=404382 RepID=UPI0030DD1C71
MSKVNTIGFTQTSAESFFQRIKSSHVKKVVDVRLNNTSQLAGFAKAGDLKFFLKTICNVDYVHYPDLAPTKIMLDQYKKEKGDWSVYEGKFRDLMAQRQIEKKLDPAMLDGACLLCSEAKPHNCHRKIVCDYLNDKWGGILSIKHL